MPELPPGPGSLPVDGLALVILDGWGLAEPGPGNAVSLADTPTFDELWAAYPHTRISASGHDVGLPDGQMGNSEVGHLNLGAGSVVKQDLARIDGAIADGSFFENEVLVGACERARKSPRGRLHLLGLVSDGGVHSGWEHIEACIELAAREGVPDLVVHAFTDGRDTSPSGGARLHRGGRALAAQRRADRHRRRSLLRDGPRPPLGAHEARLRRSRPRPGRAGRVGCGGRRRRLRGRGHRRVHQADGDRRLRRDAARRRRHGLQLPARPDAPADRGARRSRLRRLRAGRRSGARHLDDGQLPRRVEVPGRLPAARPGDDDGRGDQRGGGQAAPRRRDREVRPRDLLLQRRPRGGVGRGGASACRVAPRRARPTTTSPR